MKRASASEYFTKDFVIPKKTRSDAEPDLYTQVISNDQYDDQYQHSEYDANYTASEQFNEAPAGSFLVEPVFNSQNLQNLIYASTSMPKEVPKLGNMYRNTQSYLEDASLPKVLSMQFQPLFCKLCNLQLSSNTMAKLHYESKKHNKKVRQFLIEYAEETGEPLHPKALPSSGKNKNLQEDKDPSHYHCSVCDLPLTGRLHAESHYMGRNHLRAITGNAPAGKGHFDATGKWVREVAVKGLPMGQDNIGLAFSAMSLPIPMKRELKAEDLQCDLCNVAVTSEEQMNLHLSGQKHKKRLNQSGTAQIMHIPVVESITVPNFSEEYYANTNLSAFRTPSGNYYCEPCNTTVNSEIPFKQHLSSKKHAKKVSATHIVRPALPPSQPKKVKVEEKTVTCDICKVSVTSEMQYTIHVNGQKHKRMCEEQGLIDPSDRVFSNGSDNIQFQKYRTPSGLYYCKRCNLTLNTEAQFKSHITGKRHWSNVSSSVVSTSLGIK